VAAGTGIVIIVSPELAAPRLKGFDMYAGAGGFTLAAAREGVDIILAVNHWPLAIDVHAANNPETEHRREDLCRFDFAGVDPFDVLVAGASCQPHSRAGNVGRKHSAKVADDHEQMRATMWAIEKCLRLCLPPVAIVENVPDIDRWYDLERWLRAIERLGYVVTQQNLTASFFGVPQRRVRRFFIMVLDGPAISIENPDVPEVGVDTIFDASATGWVDINRMRRTVSKRGHLTAREKARHANRRLGGALGWGMHVNHEAAWGRPASEPINTITTKAGQLWWVLNGRYRLWTDLERRRGVGFPDGYNLLGANKTQTAKLLGNAVPPAMAAAVIRAATAHLRVRPSSSPRRRSRVRQLELGGLN
jgi:DNA (cytosine-5)-methyltransferase 1